MMVCIMVGFHFVWPINLILIRVTGHAICPCNDMGKWVHVMIPPAAIRTSSPVTILCTSHLHAQAPELVNNILFYSNLSFACLFGVEAVLKLIGLGAIPFWPLYLP